MYDYTLEESLVKLNKWFGEDLKCEEGEMDDYGYQSGYICTKDDKVILSWTYYDRGMEFDNEYYDVYDDYDFDENDVFEEIGDLYEIKVKPIEDRYKPKYLMLLDEVYQEKNKYMQIILEEIKIWFGKGIYIKDDMIFKEGFPIIQFSFQSINNHFTQVYKNENFTAEDIFSKVGDNITRLQIKKKS